jgi:hypothetical protein
MSFLTRLLLTLFGMTFAVLFTLGVLCWFVFYVAFACVRWLVTGQKPQVLLMWQQIQAMRQGIQQGSGRFTQHRDANRDIVEDVVVREVHEKRQLPKD